MNHSDHNARNINANNNNPLVTLSSDLLCAIFSINADVFNYSPPDRILIKFQPSEFSNNPLLNLRNSSQVCSTWRGIILESPLLWARSIDLNHLLHLEHSNVIVEEDSDEEDGDTWKEPDPARYLWLNEILRRTEKAPLWVKGSNIHQISDVYAVLGLLKSEWHRTERLVIDNISAHTFSSDFENILTKPAPYLQQFRLEIIGLQVPSLSLCASSIFSDSALRLLNLDVFNFSIDLHATWLSNLRVLGISMPSVVHQLLDVLGHTPLLNTLRIESFFIGTNIDYSRMVILEHLETIELRLSSENAAALLQRIIPSPRCSLAILQAHTYLYEFERNIFNPIVAFAQRFVAYNQPIRIALAISKGSFKIQLITGEKHGPEFIFEFSNVYGVDSVNAMVIISLIKAFSLQEIACATEFQFYQHDPIQTVLFESFAALLSNVGVFITDEYSLINFFESQSSASSSQMIFPLLQSIRLNTCDVLQFYSSRRLKNVMKRLRDEGRQLDVVDITEYKSGYYSPKILEDPHQISSE